MPKIIGPPTPRFNLINWHDQETYIVLIFRYGPGRQIKHSIGFKINPNDWDRKAQRARHSRNCPESGVINTRLAEYETACLELYWETISQPLAPAEFLRRLKLKMEGPDNGGASVVEERPKPTNLLKFATQHFEDRSREANVGLGTLSILKNTILYLEKFSRAKKQGVEFSDVNDKFFTDFRDFLFTPPNSFSSSYVHRLAKVLKYLMELAWRRGLHQNMAYKGFRIAIPAKRNIYLDFDELDALAALNLIPGSTLEKARDLFLIGAYSGLRYSDFTRIDPGHIFTKGDQKMIRMSAEKTDQLIAIPLLPTLDAVLSKYNYVSPKLSNQKMNGHLKTLGRMAGFTAPVVVNETKGGVNKEKKVPKWQLLATHTARRSFATNFYNTFPHLLKDIMKITGHTTEALFRKYVVSDIEDSALAIGRAFERRTA